MKEQQLSNKIRWKSLGCEFADTEKKFKRCKFKDYFKKSKNWEALSWCHSKAVLMEGCTKVRQRVTNAVRPWPLMRLSLLMLPGNTSQKVSSRFNNFRLWSSHHSVTDATEAAVTNREVRLRCMANFSMPIKRQDLCANGSSGVVCFSCSSSVTSRCIHPIGGTAIYLWKSGRQLSAKQFPKYTFHLSVEETPHCAQRNKRKERLGLCCVHVHLDPICSSLFQK